MSCPRCGGCYLGIDSCSDDDLWWEDWFCFDCQHRWQENYQKIYWGEEE